MWFTSISVLITMLTLISILMRRVPFPQVWYSMGGLFSQQNSDPSPQIVMPGCPQPPLSPQYALLLRPTRMVASTLCWFTTWWFDAPSWILDFVILIPFSYTLGPYNMRCLLLSKC